MVKQIDNITLEIAKQTETYPIQLIKFQLDEIYVSDPNRLLPNGNVNPLFGLANDTSLYLSTCYRNLNYDDGTNSDDSVPVPNGEKLYIAGSSILSLSAVEETQDIKTNAISIQLNGVPNTIIAALENVQAIGGKVTIYQAFWNEETNSIEGSVYEKWSGLINSHSVDEENQDIGNVRITIECKNLIGSVLNTKSGRYTSDSSFTNTNGGDRSMEFVASLVNFNPRFGSEE